MEELKELLKQNRDKMLPRPTQEELEIRHRLHSLLKESPLTAEDLMANLSIYMYRKSVAQLLFLNEIYQKILPVHGTIMRFGVYWGREMSHLIHLRGIYEPYNFSRRIVGFSICEDNLKIKEQDNEETPMKRKILGKVASLEYRENHLQKILECHELQAPLSHIRRFELIEGNPTITVPNYIQDHPEAIMALVSFNFNLYQPTKTCLEAIKDRLVKGSILTFNELNEVAFPGVTLAVQEVFGLTQYPIRRVPYVPQSAYIVIE